MVVEKNTPEHKSYIINYHYLHFFLLLVFFLFKKETDHSYIVFLMLHLLNNDQTLSHSICGRKEF